MKTPKTQAQQDYDQLPKKRQIIGRYYEWHIVVATNDGIYCKVGLAKKIGSTQEMEHCIIVDALKKEIIELFSMPKNDPKYSEMGYDPPKEKVKTLIRRYFSHLANEIIRD